MNEAPAVAKKNKSMAQIASNYYLVGNRGTVALPLYKIINPRVPAPHVEELL